MIALVPVLPRYARALWPVITHWVEAACEHNGGWWSAPDVLDDVEADRLTLWAVADESRLWGIVVTEVETAANYAIGVIALCAGDEQARWLHLLPELEEWAACNGCSEMMVKGRPGWARRLKSYGYGERYVAVGKVIA